MQYHRDHAETPFRRISTPSLTFSLVIVALVWLGLLIYDLLVANIWGDPPALYGLRRDIFPLVALLPAALRLMRPPEIDLDQDAYRLFIRLSVVLLILTGTLLVIELIPFEYSTLATPASLWSFSVGRVAGLITMLGLPIMAEYLSMLYRYRNRGSGTRLWKTFTTGVIVVGLLAQFIPLDYDETELTLSPFIYAIGGVPAILSFILAVRTNWVINLRKGQKWSLVGLSSLGFLAACGLLFVQQYGDTGAAMTSVAPGLSALAYTLGASILFLHMVVFVSSLFALPTAEAIDRRNAEVSSLANLARLLTRSLDTGELIDTAIAITCDATGASAAWIELKEGETSEVLRGSDPKLSAKTVRELMEVPVMKGVTIAHAVRMRRRTEMADRLHGIMTSRNGTSHEIRSLAATPLQLGDTLLGALYAAKDRADGFDREEIVVLDALANQIAMAIEQARLVQSSIEKERFEQEMLIAQDLQQRLLPTEMPQSGLYEIYAESLPASIVGGDYYDVVTFSDGSLGVLVADVSGKGASAALYMGMIKGIIQALSGRCATPRELLAQANVALHGSIDQRWFATMTCAQILEADRRLRIARAGHCPTLLIRRGIAAYSRPRGLGLAIAKPYLFDRNLEIEEIDFSPGDYALFFSDGLTEARAPDGEEFGYDALLDAVTDAAAAGASLRQMRDAIFTKIEAFAQGVPPGDDSTLVILRWK